VQFQRQVGILVFECEKKAKRLYFAFSSEIFVFPFRYNFYESAFYSNFSKKHIYQQKCFFFIFLEIFCQKNDFS
jgi:hypothetical protein